MTPAIFLISRDYFLERVERPVNSHGAQARKMAFPESASTDSAAMISEYHSRSTFRFGLSSLTSSSFDNGSQLLSTFISLGPLANENLQLKHALLLGLEIRL